MEHDKFMELRKFVDALWISIQADKRNNFLLRNGKTEPDVILVSIARLQEMREAIGESMIGYSPEHGMLRFMNARILTDPTKGNDDFEVLYNTK